MMIIRFLFLTICFLLSVLQSSHARDDTRVLSHVVSRENSAELCGKMFVGVMCAPGLLGTEAEYCAAGDMAKFASYQKTLNYVIDFAIEHGITGAYNRKFAYAGGNGSKGFNLKKPETVQYRTVNPNGAKKTDGKTKDQATSASVQNPAQTFTELDGSCNTLTQLNWNVVRHNKSSESVLEHIMKHHSYEQIRMGKEIQSVFYGHPLEVISAAWDKKIKLSLKPINIPSRPNVDYYIIHWENAGYIKSGITSSLRAGLHPIIECDYITICTQKGTNNIINAYPSSKTADFDMFGNLIGKKK